MLSATTFCTFVREFSPLGLRLGVVAEGTVMREPCKNAAFDIEDPTLTVSSVDLTNRLPETTEYDVDLAVSYLVFAPQGDRPSSLRLMD